MSMGMIKDGEEGSCKYCDNARMIGGAWKCRIKCPQPLITMKIDGDLYWRKACSSLVPTKATATAN